MIKISVVRDIRKIISLLTILTGCFVLSLLIIYLWNCRGYVTCSAVIADTGIDTHIGQESASNNGGFLHYVKFKFYVDGNEYVVRQQVFNKNNYIIGKNTEIKYNPLNPKELYSTFYVRICEVISGFLILFGVLLKFVKPTKFT